MGNAAKTSDLSTVVVDFDPDGNAKSYVKLSERYPNFLARFPQDQGWSVTREFVDFLAVSGLKDLYIEAIRLGKRPDEVGLPMLDLAVLIRAQLVNKDGVAIHTAHAYQPVQQFKDLERGETSALQRLVTAAGFGGEVLDEDERRTAAQLGLPEPRMTAQPPQAQTVATQPQAEGVTPSAPKETKLAVVPIAAVSTLDRATAARTVPPPISNESAAPTKAMLSSLQHHCRLKGVAFAAPKTQAEAVEMMAKVMALKATVQ